MGCMGRVWALHVARGVPMRRGTHRLELHMGYIHGVHEHGQLHTHGRMGDGTPAHLHHSPAPLTACTTHLPHSPAPLTACTTHLPHSPAPLTACTTHLHHRGARRRDADLLGVRRREELGRGAGHCHGHLRKGV